MSRDYLKEASEMIYGNKVNLGDLVEQDAEEVTANLLSVLARARAPMQAMLRKAAAYGLGQIGDQKSVLPLNQFLDDEKADGVRDAMLAALTAINIAPTPNHSEAERCQIIEDVYHRRRPAVRF